MPTRRTGTLAALLLTAALFLAMPGLWRQALEGDANRMAQSLRPAQMRTLTVWLCPGGPSDRALLRQTCSAFEKSHPGARIYLRSVTADELQTGVLPDAVLFTAGQLALPDAPLLPLSVESDDTSGLFAGVRYAVPLWYEPSLLCYPEGWGDDPWPMLTRPGTLTLPEGVALQQLLFSCPEALRGAMTDAALGRISPTPTPSLPQHDVPPSRGQTATPAPSASQPARVISRPAEAKEGERVLALSPETSASVRYAALCRDSQDARELLAFFLQADASSAELTAAQGAQAVLPNAFACTQQEILQICLDGFTRGEDPAQTLLRLR